MYVFMTLSKPASSKACGVPVEQGAHEIFAVAGKVSPGPGGQIDLTVEDHLPNISHRVALELGGVGQPPVQELENQDPGRPAVHLWIIVLQNHLWRHVT